MIIIGAMEYITVGVRYEWDSENDFIVNMYIENPWTLKQYEEVVNQLMTSLRDLGRPCATIVDVTKFGSLPRDGNMIQILMRVDRSMPDNLFASALVGAPYGVTIFMNMLTKLSPHAKRLAIFTSSMDEAREKILARYHELQTGNL
jgi:hypothetical protein